MKYQKRILAFAVSAAMATGSFTAFAAPTGPGAPEEQPKYDEQTLARLQDNVLEFDELPLRVREYNPTMTAMWDRYNDSKEDYANMLTELESQYRPVKDLADSYNSLYQLTGNQELKAAASQLDDGYKDIVKSIRDTVNEWDDNRQATSGIRQAEKQVISGAQSAMIGYDTIRKNIATLETMVQMYQQQSDMYGRMAGLGLATQKDLVSANASLLQARSQLASLQAQEESTRRTLCHLLGYDPDSNPDIQSLPTFDMSRLDGMNLEADTKKAMGNNYTLISQRTSAKGKTNDQIATRLKMIDEGEQKLTIEMQRLYQDVMDKKAAYEAAQTGFEAAQKSYDAATRQYNSGMISQVQYVGTQISYNQKKAAFEAANLSLWQAMETYDWAIEGLATVE